MYKEHTQIMSNIQLFIIEYEYIWILLILRFSADRPTIRVCRDSSKNTEIDHNLKL